MQGFHDFRTVIILGYFYYFSLSAMIWDKWIIYFQKFILNSTTSHANVNGNNKINFFNLIGAQHELHW